MCWCNEILSFYYFGFFSIFQFSLNLVQLELHLLGRKKYYLKDPTVRILVLKIIMNKNQNQNL